MGTYLDHPVADVEAALWALLGPTGGLRLWQFDAGGDGWLTTHSIQVDARASTKKAARDLAWSARTTILAQAGQSWADAVIVDATVIMGPAWLPDENGAPRYAARYNITLHPRPSIEGEAP